MVISMKKTGKTALAGMLTALSVTLLYVGGALWALAYTMPLVCSILLVPAIDLADKRTAARIYIATAFIALFLVPEKETALLYSSFFGYYPLLRENWQRCRPTWLRALGKLILFNITMLFSQLMLIYVFGIPFENFLGKWGMVLFVISLNLLFLLFDKLYDILIVLYKRKFKAILEKYFK